MSTASRTQLPEYNSLFWDPMTHRVNALAQTDWASKNNEKRDNKQCLLDTPRRVTVNNTRFDVYETLCPQQMLVHKGSQIKNWSGECRDVIPTKLQCQTIQRSLQSPNLQREIIRKK